MFTGLGFALHEVAPACDAHKKPVRLQHGLDPIGGQSLQPDMKPNQTPCPSDFTPQAR
jgi:hypothetical protein